MLSLIGWDFLFGSIKFLLLPDCPAGAEKGIWQRRREVGNCEYTLELTPELQLNTEVGWRDVGHQHLVYFLSCPVQNPFSRGVGPLIFTFQPLGPVCSPDWLVQHSLVWMSTHSSLGLKPPFWAQIPHWALWVEGTRAVGSPGCHLFYSIPTCKLGRWWH